MRRLVLMFGICSIAAVGMGALYAAWMIHHGFTTRAVPNALEGALAASMRDMAIPARYKGMRNSVTVTPEVLHEGMKHWADHCAACHANDGSGNTMYGKTMYPRPPDMRQTDTQKMSDGELYYTIQNGIMLSGMPAFGEPGDNDLDSWKLVAFIRHLPSITQSDLADMEKMNPKSPEELEEEQQEEQFLQGGQVSPQSPPSHHH